MLLSGFTDEATTDWMGQLEITQSLGWSYISVRTIAKNNVHDLPKLAFDRCIQQLEKYPIKVAEFGTLIGNWAKSIHSPWSVTEDEIRRCIPRMHAMKCTRARIMSYAQEPWGQDQHPKERFKRLREIVRLFKEEGIMALHENCMNYGGFSAKHTIQLLNEVPDMRLIFDTGNPVFQPDRSISGELWQNSWEFYKSVKPAIVHLHIKDARHSLTGVCEYTFPGEGEGHVAEILADLKASDFKGFLAIEPHMGKVFHESSEDNQLDDQCRIYSEYAKKLEILIESIP